MTLAVKLAEFIRSELVGYTEKGPCGYYVDTKVTMEGYEVWLNLDKGTNRYWARLKGLKESLIDCMAESIEACTKSKLTMKECKIVAEHSWASIQKYAAEDKLVKYGWQESAIFILEEYMDEEEMYFYYTEKYVRKIYYKEILKDYKKESGWVFLENLFRMIDEVENNEMLLPKIRRAVRRLEVLSRK